MHEQHSASSPAQRRGPTHAAPRTVRTATIPMAYADAKLSTRGCIAVRSSTARPGDATSTAIRHCRKAPRRTPGGAKCRLAARSLFGASTRHPTQDRAQGTWCAPPKARGPWACSTARHARRAVERPSVRAFESRQHDFPPAAPSSTCSLVQRRLQIHRRDFAPFPQHAVSTIARSPSEHPAKRRLPAPKMTCCENTGTSASPLRFQAARSRPTSPLPIEPAQRQPYSAHGGERQRRPVPRRPGRRAAAPDHPNGCATRRVRRDIRLYGMSFTRKLGPANIYEIAHRPTSRCRERNDC